MTTLRLPLIPGLSRSNACTAGRLQRGMGRSDMPQPEEERNPEPSEDERLRAALTDAERKIAAFIARGQSVPDGLMADVEALRAALRAKGGG